MGVMASGEWLTDDDVARAGGDGRWTRAPSLLGNWITRDGSPGPTGDGGFPAEPGRYHLYAAWNCPWAHRALLARVVRGLEDAIAVSFVRPERTDQGWVFDRDGDFRDRVSGLASLHRVYACGCPGYSGRVTVPLLTDLHTGRIVSNESADIVRMLGEPFDYLVPDAPDLYPPIAREAVDVWNDLVHRHLNNGVYRAGFAMSQEAYEEAVAGVFAMLDAIEKGLGEADFLCGSSPTEADWRLLPTLVRFDVGYAYAFKCNLRLIRDYPRISAYAERLLATPGVRATVRPDIYRLGYHSRSKARNPHGIVPLGPRDYLGGVVGTYTETDRSDGSNVRPSKKVSTVSEAVAPATGKPLTVPLT